MTRAVEAGVTRVARVEPHHVEHVAEVETWGTDDRRRYNCLRILAAFGVGPSTPRAAQVGVAWARRVCSEALEKRRAIAHPPT